MACSAWASTKTSLLAFSPFVQSPLFLTPFSRSQILSSKLELMEAAYEIKIQKKLKERDEEKDNEVGEIFLYIYLLLLFKNTLMQLITNF